MLNETIVEVRGVKLNLRRGGTGAALLFLHGPQGFAGSEAALERLAQRFDVLGTRSSGLRQIRRARLARRCRRSVVLLSRCARRAGARQGHDRRPFARRLDRARDGGALDRAHPRARARRLGRHPHRRRAARRHVHRARRTSSRACSSPATDRRHGRRRSRRRRSFRIFSTRTASPRRNCAGSRGSSIRSSRSGCIASTGRPASCGARRTRSSRPPMAAASPS